MAVERRYVAGHAGLVGQALVRAWGGRTDLELLTATRADVDLTDPQAVARFLQRSRPDTVVIAAGLVGGIAANAGRPAEFIYQNLMIEANLIHEAWRAGASRVLNFGSSCMYPKQCEQPMRPEQLMTGPVELTSAPYALAKLAGWVMGDAYRAQHGLRCVTAIPCTLYGPGDHVDPQGAHVISALIRKFHDARLSRRSAVTLWGTGAARREFLYVDDLPSACDVLLAQNVPPGPVNIGSGESRTIRELAELIARAAGFEGRIEWDASKPEGAPDKRLDSTTIRALGWSPKTDLDTGIRKTLAWYLAQEAGVPAGVAA